MLIAKPQHCNMNLNHASIYGSGGAWRFGVAVHESRGGRGGRLGVRVASDVHVALSLKPG